MKAIKIILGLFLCFVLFSVGLVVFKSQSNTSQLTPTPAPPQDLSSIKQQVLKEKRVDVLAKNKQALSRDGIEADIIGDKKDTLILRSTSLNTFEITQILKNSLQDFRDVGFEWFERLRAVYRIVWLWKRKLNRAKLRRFQLKKSHLLFV